MVFQALPAQILTGFSARFNDAFVEWEVFSDSADEQGNLTMTWQKPDDWTQWTYRLGDQTGTIKAKWNNDLSQWEVRGSNKIITLQPVWQTDPNLWRLTDNVYSIEVQTKWRGRWDEWTVDDRRAGQMTIFTEYQNDPRDWIIDDRLDPSVNLPMKMAIIFIVILNSIPR
jgi:hypothetical protein